MNETRILLVEDDRILVLLLTESLRAEGYVVDVVTRGDEAVERASRGGMHLILLDVTLPAKNGFDVCRELREKGIEAPVLMLTARDEVTDRVQGLKLGADDYLTKPFEMEELKARIAALLRRAQAHPLSVSSFDCGDLKVDFRRAALWLAGEPVDLSAVELKLLRYFIEHRGEVLTREELLKKVWGYSAGLHTRTVDVHVRYLRQKIERDPAEPAHIVTVHGIGYRFLPDR